MTVDYRHVIISYESGKDAMSRNEIYHERIELRLSEGQKIRVQLEAERRELTMNQLLRNLIDKYC